MRVLGRPEGSGGRARDPGGGCNPPDRAFATATLVAAVVVVLAGTLGTLWLRGWGRVGFEVPSMPWYFSFPFYGFPGPQLELGWTAATLPVVAVHGACQAAPGSAGRSLAVWLPGDLLAFGGMLGVPLLAALAGRTVTVVRQLLAWRVRAPAVIGLLVAQTLLVQVLFHTRW